MVYCVVETDLSLTPVSRSCAARGVPQSGGVHVVSQQESGDWLFTWMSLCVCVCVFIFYFFLIFVRSSFRSIVAGHNANKMRNKQ